MMANNNHDSNKAISDLEGDKAKARSIMGVAQFIGSLQSGVIVDTKTLALLEGVKNGDPNEISSLYHLILSAAYHITEGTADRNQVMRGIGVCSSHLGHQAWGQACNGFANLGYHDGTLVKCLRGFPGQGVLPYAHYTPGFKVPGYSLSDEENSPSDRTSKGTGSAAEEIHTYVAPDGSTFSSPDKEWVRNSALLLSQENGHQQRKTMKLQAKLQAKLQQNTNDDNEYQPMNKRKRYR